MNCFFFPKQDKMDGYILQNKFLNVEILELGNLRAVDDQKIDGLKSKVRTKVVRYCRVY